MYGYAPRYPMGRVGTTFRVGLVVLGVLSTAPLVAWGAFAAKREVTSYVVFANGDRAVELVVDGAARGELPAGESVTIALAPGEHQVSAGADRATFSIPARANDTGFRALYNIGGGAGLAVVTKYYSVGPVPFDRRIEPIPEGTRFTALPDALAFDSLPIDRAFPTAVSAPHGTPYVALTHVCHVAAGVGGEATVGCAGY
jgi:hypothetical protein